MRSECSPEVIEARCEELLNWMSSNLNKIDDSLNDVDWLMNSVKIEDEADSGLFMARMVKIKSHLVEYLKKQREEYTLSRSNALIAQQRAEAWMLLVRPGDIIRTKCLTVGRNDEKIKSPTEVLGVILPGDGQSGIQYRVLTENGTLVELDAAFFYPGPSSIISMHEFRKKRG